MDECLPSIYKLLTETDLQRELLYSSILSILKPWQLSQGRAHVLAELLERYWGIHGNVSNMPMNPRWTINATCYETGKNWRFIAERMGDYVANYVIKPNYPLADAIATSAAFPGLIGPLKIMTGKYKWFKYDKDKDVPPIATKPLAKKLTLWDGGVYDNLGAEALYKPSKGLKEGINFLFVSDASKPLDIEEQKWPCKINSLLRLLNIPLDQVRALRAREMFCYFDENKNGGYLIMGKTISGLFEQYNVRIDCDQNRCLNEQVIERVFSFPTTLRKLKEDEFGLIYRHGYETCSAILSIRGISEELVYFDRNKYPWLKS
jgi:NTE family protein